jgi:hydrogenase maturation factor
MCLGEIVQLVEVRPDGRAFASSETRTVEVSLLTLDDADYPVDAGDWVVVHSGFALARISSQEALEALSLRSRVLTTASVSGAEES